MATIWPGLTASAAAAVTCASTLPTATATPSGRPVQAAARAVRRPARSPSAASRTPCGLVADLAGGQLADETGEAGVQLGQELLRRVTPVLEDALVADGADVAALDAGELPDDPVGGLDPALGPGVHLGGLLQQLKTLGELPLGGDLAAVARQPALAPARGQLVDPVGVRLGGVVLPQLGPGVRLAGRLVAQRRAVGPGRHDGAGGEVGADADHLLRPHARGGDSLGDGGPQHVDPVLGRLQRPVGAEPLAGGERLLHDAVRVLVDGTAQLGAVAHADDDGPP